MKCDFHLALNLMLALLVCAASGCAKTVKHAGGLELVIATDLQTPSDFDMIHLEISQETASSNWYQLVGRDVRIPSESTLPTTYSIEAGGSDDQEALIVVTARRGGVNVVERVVQTQVPKDRVAELRMVLVSRCVGKLTCPTGESCQPDSGICGSNKIDSSTLPAYVPGSETQFGPDASMNTPDAPLDTPDARVVDAADANAVLPDSADADSVLDGADQDADDADSGLCKPGTKLCIGNVPHYCLGDGTWFLPGGGPCVGQACRNGTCVGVCVPQTTQCSSDNTVQTCTAEGQWVDTQSCTNQVCVNGACQDICVPGVTQCDGLSALHTCTDQKQWGQSNPCPTDAPSCLQGICTTTASCLAGGPGQSNCGPDAESCCTSLSVPGGTFYRSYDEPTSQGFDPATLSDFRLDKYSITVGRFRAFVNAGGGTQANPPAAGAGANPHLAGSGWDSSWNQSLLAQYGEQLTCDSNTRATWTDSPGANENLPMTCITWFEAFAFCIWDGGRLPTEAELLYARGGGSEERAYPWSNPASSLTIDCTYANYKGASNGTDFCVLPGTGGPNDVGSEWPKGAGKWGQADLVGNVGNWCLDWAAGSVPVPCDDCAVLTQGTLGRVIGGSSPLSTAAELVFSYLRWDTAPTDYTIVTGARCARLP